jgi:DNA-binding winged helix-turn-helix (wHTH) protein
MRYSFNDVVFDSERLILSKQDEIIPCRPNEAKLLALFLAEPQTVFSKDNILDRVWAGKVVSEQAVFQSISNLRSLFGEEAIKTFPKKGYQWQVTACVLESVSSALPEVEEVPYVRIYLSNRRLFVGFTVAIIASVAVLFYLLNSYKFDSAQISAWPLLIDSQNQNSPALQSELVEPLWSALLDTGNFQPVATAQNEDYRDFFYLPEKYTQRVGSHKNSSLIMGFVGERKGKVFVRYLLKNHSNRWSAEIEANTRTQLIEKLLSHLAHVMRSRLVAVDTMDPVLINAELKLLHNTYPDDLVIFYRLAQSQLGLGNLSNTLILAEQLRDKAQVQNDNLYLGFALLIWGQALRQQQLLGDAEQKLQQALVLFKDAQNYRMASEVQVAIGNLAFDNGNYEQMKTWNLQAME